MNLGKGFTASPSRRDIPRFCGKCHSSAEIMKRFNPAERIDQEADYYTSVHDKRLRQGRTESLR